MLVQAHRSARFGERAALTLTGPPRTRDGRYIVVRGRLWRAADPDLSPERRDAVVRQLMDARRAVGRAKRAGDPVAESDARVAVDAAKVASGERGPPWWKDGTPDRNRHLVRNTEYAAWYDALTNHPDRPPVLIGTAGWSIPRDAAEAFPTAGTHLQRYAGVMPAVEINSSFYRAHRRSTYERWAASVPEAFRFSVKMPQEISHVRTLLGFDAPLDAFVDQIGGLGTRLGVVLVQLPPSLAFEPDVASAFLDGLRQRVGAGVGIACEPRHASWFTEQADARLAGHRVARVAADPVLVPGGERPGGWTGLRYHRLHGSPRVYHSSYDRQRIEALTTTLACDVRSDTATWCIFDNTASGAATLDALALTSSLHDSGS